MVSITGIDLQINHRLSTATGKTTKKQTSFETGPVDCFQCTDLAAVSDNMLLPKLFTILCVKLIT